MQVRVFRAIDGAPIEGSNIVPFGECSWKLALNEAGSMDIRIPASRLFSQWSARSKLRPWYAVAALIDGGEVIHAGPVLRRKWTPRGGLGVTVGGAWDLFSKRLVLNHDLEAAWVDGEVLLDEDNPSPEWVLQFAGLSLGGIGAALIREALKWGPLCVDEPGLEPGVHVRTYNGWDFASVSDRLEDLTGVINGPRIEFVPYLRADGHLRFRYEASQAGGTYHRLSTAFEGHGISVEDVDEDGGSLATEVYALGGRAEDIVLTARHRSSKLTAQGYPVMQEALKSHTSVSRVTTLQDHVSQRVLDGSTVPESTQLRLRRSLGVRPGDVLDLVTRSSYHGKTDQTLHVVEASGSATSEWVTVSAFPEEV